MLSLLQANAQFTAGECGWTTRLSLVDTLVASKLQPLAGSKLRVIAEAVVLRRHPPYLRCRY
jgi:hypothetical protein